MDTPHKMSRSESSGGSSAPDQQARQEALLREAEDLQWLARTRRASLAERHGSHARDAQTRARTLTVTLLLLGAFLMLKIFSLLRS